MDFRQLKQFLAVSETLNINRAAERLHMAQPALSVAMRKLEEEIGVPLLVRQPRGVSLTEAGAAIKELAQRCLREMDQIRSIAQSIATGNRGRIQIGFVGSTTYRILPALVPAFRSRFPQVDLILREGANLELLNRLGAGDLDLAFVRHPTFSTIHPDLRFDVVERDHLCAALPQGHPLETTSQLTMLQLAEEPFIDYVSTQVPGLHELVARAFQSIDRTPVVAQVATQVPTVLSLVQSGLGVALVPAMSRLVAPRNVVFRLVGGLPDNGRVAIALAFRADNPNAAAVRFRELAQEVNYERNSPRSGAKLEPIRRARKEAATRHEIAKPTRRRS